MDKTDFEVQAKFLMTAHGVGSLEFKWSRTKRAIASMHFVEFLTTGVRLCKHISFSEYWVKVLTVEECHDVMLHEIAHALTVDERYDHGPQFVAKCRELGTPATRHCYQPKQSIEVPWKGTCKVHGVVSNLYRAPLRVSACIKCSRTFNFDYLLTWTKNGNPVRLADMPARYQNEYTRMVARYSLPTQLANIFGG